MRIHQNVKPVVWGAVAGAVSMACVGFWGLGWTTTGSADRLGSTRADAAVAEALVPFCIGRAQSDPDQAKLVAFRAESSSWSRTQLVRDAGWATIGGMTSPDGALATACSEKLFTTQKTG